MNSMSDESILQILAQRAAELARSPERQTRGDPITLAMIRLGDEIFALDTEYISDVRPLPPVTRLPRVPGWVLGLINLRGQILSVVDLRQYLGLPAPTRTDLRPRLALVQCQGIETALLVDDILAIESLTVQHIQAVHDLIHGISPELVRGVLLRNHVLPNLPAEAVTVIDLPAVIGSRNFLIHEEMI